MFYLAGVAITFFSGFYTVRKKTKNPFRQGVLYLVYDHWGASETLVVSGTLDFRTPASITSKALIPAVDTINFTPSARIGKWKIFAMG